MNPCDDCALCCINTEMTLSKKDIALILTAFKSDIREGDFIELKPNGLAQLKNIEDHCVFLDPHKKLCKIYDLRPAGCRFYPIVYDIEENKCIYDKDCPRINLFRISNKPFKTLCNRIKNFLINELGISI